MMINVNWMILSNFEIWLREGPLKVQKLSDSKYSGGQLRRTGKNVFFCAPATTEIMETNNVPLKTPIKLLPEMKKKIWNFQNLFGFRDLFWKSNFLENGRGRHQIGAIPIHYTFIFN